MTLLIKYSLSLNRSKYKAGEEVATGAAAAASREESEMTATFRELSLRANVFDGDEFDVFKGKATQLNLTKIHQGKK